MHDVYGFTFGLSITKQNTFPAHFMNVSAFLRDTTQNAFAARLKLGTPLSPLLIRSSSSRYVVSRLPLALSGAVTGMRPKILNWVNCTLTCRAADCLRVTADTCRQQYSAPNL